MSRQERLMEAALRELSRRHAAQIRAEGPIMILYRDPCPACRGQVLASDTVARCSNCGWSYRELADDPVASRRADP